MNEGADDDAIGSMHLTSLTGMHNTDKALGVQASNALMPINH
jgi:hypothetical protein